MGNATLQSGGDRTGSGRWKTAVFRLDQPAFRGRQPHDADFRLCGDNLILRSVKLTHPEADGKRRVYLSR